MEKFIFVHSIENKNRIAFHFISKFVIVAPFKRYFITRTCALFKLCLWLFCFFNGLISNWFRNWVYIISNFRKSFIRLWREKDLQNCLISDDGYWLIYFLSICIIQQPCCHRYTDDWLMYLWLFKFFPVCCLCLSLKFEI